MIKLKNIVIDGKKISCDIIPEDCKEKGYMQVDIEKNDVEEVVLPAGYEWCKNHVQHAKQYLLNAFSSQKEIPKEKTLMWC